MPSSRREFLAQCAAVPLIAELATAAEPDVSRENSWAHLRLKAPKIPEVDLTREVEALLKFVDPKVRYRHVPLDAEKNAWPFWQQAMKAYVQEPGDDEFYEGTENIYLDPSKLSDAARRRILEWVSQNKECRKLTDAGIAHGTMELPRATKSIRLELATMGEIPQMRSLARVKSTNCRVRLTRNDFAGALDEAVSILRMGAMLVRSECLLVDYLTAQLILGIGAHAMYQVAMAPGVSDEQARSCIDRLAAAKATPDDFKRAQRVEFCRWFLPCVAEFPRNADATELATRYVLGPVSADFNPSDRAVQDYQRSIRQTAMLLEGHPKPLDKEATIRLASELHARYFDLLEKPFIHRQRDLFDPLKRELSDWPAEVAPDMWVAADIDGLFGEHPNPPRKLSNRDLKRARDALRAVDNLLGKRMIVDHSSWLSTPFLEMQQARVEAARLRIALRLYEKQYGQLPATLENLVPEKLLPEVPIDPYDGNRFRYSRDRRVIWCVGQDGKNEGIIPEQQDGGSTFDEDIDMTWQIKKS